MKTTRRRPQSTKATQRKSSEFDTQWRGLRASRAAGSVPPLRVERRSSSVKSEAALQPCRYCAGTIASLSLEQGSPPRNLGTLTYFPRKSSGNR